MRKIIVSPAPKVDTIPADKVMTDTAIFAKKGDRLVGMLVHETQGWILRLGGGISAHGISLSLHDALERGERYGYTFYIEN